MKRSWVATWMGDCVTVCIQLNHSGTQPITKINSAFHPYGVGKSSNGHYYCYYYKYVGAKFLDFMMNDTVSLSILVLLLLKQQELLLLLLLLLLQTCACQVL